MTAFSRRIGRVGRLMRNGRLAPRYTAAAALLSIGIGLAATLPAVAQAKVFDAKPVTLTAPKDGNDPLIAYDPASRTTFVIWQNTQDSRNGIYVCVLPLDKTKCSGGGAVLLTDPNTGASGTGGDAVSPGGVVVLPNGNVVITGQPVYGGSITWESSGNGSAFLTTGHGLEDDGDQISPVSEYYHPGNLVALSDSDIGVLDDYFGYFSDSPFAGPESPPINGSDYDDESSNVNGDANGVFQGVPYFASGSQLGAEQAPAPDAAGTDIVVGVGDNYEDGDTHVPGCGSDAEGTGYGVSVGTVDGTSKAGGTLNSEGLPGYGLLTCAAEAPVLASGGSDGIGVLEDEGSGIAGTGNTYTVQYKRFKATPEGGSFGSAVTLAKTVGYSEDLDVVDVPGSAAVYAMWEDDGVYVDYSPDGGSKWDGVVAIPNAKNSSGDDIIQGDPLIAGVGRGQLYLAYDNNIKNGDQTFVQEIDAIPQTRVTTKQKSGSKSGADITITHGTKGESDLATIFGAGVSTAGGKVLYSLYPTKSCKSGTRLFKSSKSVSHGVAKRSAGVNKVLKAGEYYWIASYSGDANHQSSISRCGAEKLTVKS